METCIISYKNETPVQVPYRILGAGDLEEWNGEGGMRGVQDGEHVYAHGIFTLMCSRTNTTLQSN